MYQALYRKYRPSNFLDVVGQNVIIKTLKNSIENNKISHAYLFTGPRGTGKTTIAKIFAKEINGVQNTQKNVENLDIIEIDAASNNGVDEIRELKSKVNLVPSVGKYKVYIIDEVHMLTVGAFNALLKTLEEPPAHIIFILATTEPHKIPITILSRCQRYDFKKISLNQIINRLKQIVETEKIQITEEALLEIAKLSDGGMRDAISILDQTISYANDNITIKEVHEINGTISKDRIIEFILFLLDNNLKESLQIINNLDDEGKNIIKIVEDITLFLKDVLLSYSIQMDSKDYEQINQKATHDNIYHMIKEFSSLLPEMKLYGNPKFILEVLLIKLINQSIMNHNISQEIKKEEEKETSFKQVEKEEIEPTKETNNVTIVTKEEMLENSKKQIKEIIELNEKAEEEEEESLSEELISNIIKTRINNAFTAISKKRLLELKEKVEDIRPYLLDETMKESALLVLDGELKAASPEYLIMVYENARMAIAFNQNIKMIEKLLKKSWNETIKVIAVNSIEWEIYRSEYKDKQGNYVYITENFVIPEKEEKKTVNEIDHLFGEVLEYQK